MEHSIATDEAGYGPNLGPLVIGASRWSFSEDGADPRLALRDFVFDQKSLLSKFESQTSTPGLMIADSKAVYSTGKIELLERGVLASLFAIHEAVPKTVGELLSMFAVDQQTIQSDDYFRCHEVKLPFEAEVSTVKTLGGRIKSTLADADQSLEDLRIAVVFPKSFNATIETLGNKASCLTAESLTLVARMMDSVSLDSGDHFDIRCDKHGGRNRYAPSIQEHFDRSWVTIEEETRPISSYRFDDGESRIRFSAKGESWLPIALASMCAKYVREIFMKRWNRYWIAHLPHLKPTKGYPVDARRFKQDIQQVQKKIGIPDKDIWRIR